MKILGVLGAVIALVLALGTVTYYVNLSANTYRAMNGDSSAVGAIVNDTTNQIVDEVQYSVGITLVLEVLGILAAIGLPVGALIAFVKKYD